MKTHVVVVLVLVAAIITFTDAARLLLMPASVNSHVNYFARLGLALAEEGHEVTTLVPSVSRVPEWSRHDRLEVIRYSVPGTEPFTNSPRATELLIKQAFTDSLMEQINALSDFGEAVLAAWDAECEALLTNTELNATLHERKFDHAVVDSAHMSCQVVLPYSLDLPMSAMTIYFYTWVFRVPALPSFIPSLSSSFTDHMTFMQRVQNTLVEVAAYFMQNTNDLERNIRKYAPHKQEVHKLEMLAQLKLWFALHDIATGYPFPLMPNVIPVGDVLAVAAKPLTSELLKFVESAPEGVILVSFGSTFDHLPQEVILKICSALRRVPQKTIWKLKQSDLCVEKDKILTLNWLPQNDLLGHPKVKLFLTHVGISSVVETIYHGVPIISAPIGLDQHYNAAFMTSRELGVGISLKDFTADELVEKIKLVIEDKDMLEIVKRRSAILREKPDHPGQRASFSLDHVIKYGDGHLKSGAFQLNVLQFYMVDIFLFLTMVVVVIVIIFICSLYCCCKCCRKYCCSGKVNVKEKLS